MPIREIDVIPGLDSFERAYVTAALWSSIDNADDSGGAPLDDNYTWEDIAPEALATMRKECADFRQYAAADLAKRGDDERSGIDFWLTRNGHGAGFWDRGLGSLGICLTAAAKTFGSSDLYVGDDGKIYVQ